jgi:hypothetical protein
MKLFRLISGMGILALAMTLIGCGGSSTSGTGGTKEDLAADFSKPSASANLRNSIIDIPDNIKLSAAASSGKKNKNGDDDEVVSDLFGAVRQYINFSDFLKTNVEDFIVAIVDNQVLLNAELETLIVVDDSESDMTAFKVESISNLNDGKYDWKISFYFDNNNDSPLMIFKLKFDGEKVRGQMIGNIKELLPITVNGTTTNIKQSFFVDLTFDGISSNKTLTIDFTQDLSELMTFAESNWSELSESQKDEIDLSQPGKFSLRIKYDGSEYGISGSSYSPGVHLKQTLSGEEEFLDANRSTYTFRGKSITGDIDGAKLELALPIDTLTNINNMWTNDSFSTLFREKSLSNLNLALNKLVDDVDNEENDDTDSVDYSGTTVAEQQTGWETLYWMLGEQLPIPTFSSHGEVFSSDEYTAAETFWGATKLNEFGMFSVDDLNAYIADGATTEVAKKFVYNYIMAPAVISAYQITPVSITLSQLDEIVENSGKDGDNVFKDAFQTLSRLVNPAFFDKNDGFLGTFDGTNFYSFDKSTNVLSLGEKPEHFDTINALNLTTLQSIIPNDVYNLEIEIK